jgi:hypothetical protein
MGFIRLAMNGHTSEGKKQNSFIMKVLKEFDTAPFLGLKRIDKSFSI